MSAELLVQQLVNALSLGAIYALLALGLAMIFSLLGLLNFAYGELITITGYTMLYFIAAGLPFWLAGMLGIVAAILAAVAMQFVAFRPLRGANPSTVIFATFALAMMIQALIRNLISPRPQGLPVGEWADANSMLGSIRIPVLAIVSFVVAAIAIVALTLLLRYSRWGLVIRAAAEDFSVTRLMGASAGRMIVVAFAISGSLAGIAGVLWVARTGNVAPAMGFEPLLQAFIAVVLGGLGNLRGAVIGGFLLAFIEVSLRVLLPSSLVPFTAALSLVVVVALLYFRPQGVTKTLQERVA